MLFVMTGMMWSVNGFAQAQNPIQIKDAQTWTTFAQGGFNANGTLQILAGGHLTVTGRSGLTDGRHLIVEDGGRFTMNARLDMDSKGKITMNGGEFRNTVDFKFPDSSGNQDVHIWLNGGLMVCERIQSITDRGSVLHVGGGVLRIGNAAAGDQYDPENKTAWTIVPIPPRPTVTITNLGNGWKEISAGSPFGAFNPVPADGATDVVRDVTLAWTAAAKAVKHDVYLGTDKQSVSTADRQTPLNVLVAQGQQASTFAPGFLAYGQTYYWRVDEVNDADPTSPWKGEVWSFTAEPYSYPIQKVTATASSAQVGAGPERTVDGSGLNSAGEHSNDAKDMWLSTGTQPNWIQFTFDKAYLLQEMWVWNSNQMIEPFIGFGAKSVQIEYSVDGTTWTEVKDTPDFARATGLSTYTANTTVNLAGVFAKYVKLTINSQWGTTPPCGLSEVRFSYVPVQARAPQPANAATDVAVGATLNWRPGRQAVSHKVYVSTDKQAVTDGTAAAKTVADHSFSASALTLGATYYWRVDEVNDAAATQSWAGEVWSFTVQSYAVVEDFESYTDAEGHRIYEAWADGFGSTTNGSQVGSSQAPFAEQKIVHGGKQSMPLSYGNTSTITLSEATRTFDSPQNWTTSGIKSLSLYFQGKAGNTGQLYLKINSVKVPYNGGAGDLARATWIPWNIDLSAVGNVSSVTKLTIGVEGAGAKGLVYIDDIRLYAKSPEFITPTDPGKANLKALYAFEGNANDTSGNGLNGTLKQATFASSGRPNGGSALKVDKAGYVDLGNPVALNFGTGDWTVTAWFKTAIKGTGDANKGTLFAKGGDGTGGKRYALTVSENVEGIVSLVTDDDVTKYAVDAKRLVNDDQWHFVAAQRAGTALRIYTDGQFEGNLTIPAAYDLAGASQHNAYIGALTNHADGSLYKLFSGLIDEVQVYNRALALEEVLWLSGQTTPVAKPF
jgi:hypothetical protein